MQGMSSIIGVLALMGLDIDAHGVLFPWLLLSTLSCHRLTACMGYLEPVALDIVNLDR
jgi:hypothetical protein